jgi:hypothetical protein
MGYAFYELPDGREAGYGVEAVCDEPGCAEEIDRGLGYLCGTDPGEPEDGCGGYFCGAHDFHHIEFGAIGVCAMPGKVKDHTYEPDPDYADEDDPNICGWIYKPTGTTCGYGLVDHLDRGEHQ